MIKYMYSIKNGKESILRLYHTEHLGYFLDVIQCFILCGELKIDTKMMHFFKETKL